jgi:hypothetical protein
MLSVLRIRPILDCPAIYDNYGDKVLVHCDSFLAQILTREIEERKKKLADEVTQKVFQEFNMHSHTR